MSALLAVSQWLHDWLRSEGLAYESTDDGVVFEVQSPGKTPRTVRIVNRHESGILLFGAVSAVTFPRRGWTALYPILADANASIDYGAWVLDPDSERLVFRAALPLDGATYETTCLRRVLTYVADTMTNTEQAFRSDAAS